MDKRAFAHVSNTAQKSALLISITSIFLRAGCGGGGGGGDASPQPAACFETSIQNCGPGPWDPFGIALSLAWIAGQCTAEVLCTTEPVETDFDTGIVTDEFISTNWTTATAVEIEPNNDIAEAAPFVLLANSSIKITGSVNDATDVADFVAYSTQSSDLHAIYICRAVGACTLPFLQSNEVYLDLLDQNGNVMQTTNMMQTANGHEITFMSSLGLGYFVALRALNTGSLDFDYELVITN